MIEFMTRDENSKDGTVTTYCEIVFVAPDSIGDTHRKFTGFNPAVAEMLRDRFAEAVAVLLDNLKRTGGIVLEPIDYDVCGDLLVAFRMGEFDFDPPPSLGMVLTDDDKLSMRFGEDQLPEEIEAAAPSAPKGFGR